MFRTFEKLFYVQNLFKKWYLKLYNFAVWQHNTFYQIIFKKTERQERIKIPNKLKDKIKFLFVVKII